MTPFEAAKLCRLAQLTNQEYNQEAYEIWTKDLGLNKEAKELWEDGVVAAVVEDAIDFWEKSQGDRVMASMVVSGQFSTGHSIVNHDGKRVVENLKGNIVKILR